MVPLEQLDSATRQLADAIASKSPLAIRMGKALFYEQLELNLADAYACASETMACNLDSEDALRASMLSSPSASRNGKAAEPAPIPSSDVT